MSSLKIHTVCTSDSISQSLLSYSLRSSMNSK